jgi:hypothetical protein
LIILHATHGSRISETAEYFECIHHTKQVTNTVIEARAELTGLETPFQECVRAASPYMTTLLYQMATANFCRCQDMRVDDLMEALLVTKAALKDFDERWKASGEWRGLALTES